MTTSEQQGQRISPLRGGMSREEIVNQTKIVKNGLGSLRDDHYSILASIRDDYENHKNQICNNNTEVDILHAGVVSDDDHNHDTKEKKTSPSFSKKKTTTTTNGMSGVGGINGCTWVRRCVHNLCLSWSIGWS